MEENHGGACRQFSSLLIERLTNIGIKAVMATAFSMHITQNFVVYELDGKKYVADLSHDKIYNKMLGTNDPMIFQVPLNDYLERHKDEFDEVYILKKLPQDLGITFEEAYKKGEIEIIEIH